MARTITNLLVGLGFEFDRSGEREINRAIDGVKSGAGIMGASISAAFIGAGLKVDEFAKKNNALNNSVYRLSTNTQYVQKLGGAYQALGGDAADALRTMQQWDGVLDDLRVKGQSSLLTELKPTGMDVVNLSQARDSEDFNNRFADQFAHLRPDQKRIVAEITGMSDAQFRLYSGGTKALQDQMNKAGDVLHISRQNTEEMVRYTEQTIKSDQAIQGLWATVSSKLLPAMTELRGWQAEATQKVDKFIQDNPEETKAGIAGGAVIAGSGTVAATGAVLSKFGVPGARVLGAAGPIGFAAGTAIAAEPWIDKGLNSVFGESEYFQNVRTAPTWGAFGRALIGQADAPDAPSSPATGYSPSLTWRDSDYGFHKDEDAQRANPYAKHAEDKQQLINPQDYHPSTYDNVRQADYQRQADATASAVRQVPLKVENHVETKLHIDGREIDSRIERYNERENFKTTEDLRSGSAR